MIWYQLHIASQGFLYYLDSIFHFNLINSIPFYLKQNAFCTNLFTFICTYVGGHSITKCIKSFFAS